LSKADIEHTLVGKGIVLRNLATGIASHWEVWMLASAMSPHEALRVATLDGARMLGADAQLGSLEPGKLADLMVIDGNPLADIRQSTNLTWVMRGGRLRSADAQSWQRAWFPGD